MRGKKPIFGYKDVYDLTEVFDPIIYEGLKKFLETKREKNICSIPVSVIEDYGLNPMDQTHTEEQMDEVSKYWEQLLEKMIYAFNPNKEPQMEDYNYDVEITFSRKDEKGNSLFNLTPNNEEAQENYYKAVDEWRQRVDEGRNLFIKFYDNLWW